MTNTLTNPDFKTTHRGGEYKPENLTTSCFECNQGKKDILLEERQLKGRINQNANF